MSPKPYTHRDAVAYRPLDWTGVLVVLRRRAA